VLDRIPALFIAFPTQAAELQGVVLENEVNGRPRKGWCGRYRSYRAETDSSGKFSCVFPQRAGDRFA